MKHIIINKEHLGDPEVISNNRALQNQTRQIRNQHYNDNKSISLTKNYIKNIKIIKTDNRKYTTNNYEGGLKNDFKELWGHITNFIGGIIKAIITIIMLTFFLFLDILRGFIVLLDKMIGELLTEEQQYKINKWFNKMERKLIGGLKQNGGRYER